MKVITIRSFQDIFNLIYILLRLGLGGIFIYAGVSKLLEPEIFAVLIDAYGIVPQPLLTPVAVALPVLEVLAGVGLLFEFRGSLAVITALLVLFLVVLGYGIHIGLDVDCGCFGPQDPEARALHGLRTTFYRDLVMLGGVVLMYIWRWYRTAKLGSKIKYRFFGSSKHPTQETD